MAEWCECMQRYGRRDGCTIPFGTAFEKEFPILYENKNSGDIYTIEIDSKRNDSRKTFKREDKELQKRGKQVRDKACTVPHPSREGTQNIHKESLSGLYLARPVASKQCARLKGSTEALPIGEKILSQDLAARCVPLELRQSFRKLSEMDAELRPKNTKVILDFFSKCRLCIPTENGAECKEQIEWEQDYSMSHYLCMTWVKKDGTLNTNMYFCFHGKNTLVRRILFEWFVGPTQLTKKEKEAFQKKRSRSRKKPRRVAPSCSYTLCINPHHMVAKPPLPESFLLHTKNRQRRNEHDEVRGTGDSFGHQMNKIQNGYGEGSIHTETNMYLAQAFARRCLVEAGERSFSILEGIEARRNLPNESKKKKKRTRDTSSSTPRILDMSSPSKKPMLCANNKITAIIPVLWTGGGRTGYT